MAAPWEEYNQSWFQYDGQGSVVDTRNRNPDVSPRDTMVALWENIDVTRQLAMAVNLSQQAIAEFNNVRHLPEDATQILERPDLSNDLLNDAAARLAESVAGIERAASAMETSVRLLNMAGERWNSHQGDSPYNENIVTLQAAQSRDAINSINTFLNINRIATGAIDEARTRGVQHPDFGQARQAATRSLDDVHLMSSDVNVLLYTNERDVRGVSDLGWQTTPTRNDLPDQTVDRLANTLSGGVYTDSNPHGAQHFSTTARNAQVAQEAMNILSDAGFSEHAMAWQAYHARQQHTADTFPSVQFYPEGQWSGQANSRSVGGPAGESIADETTTSQRHGARRRGARRRR
ncbi:hypothetical protein [Micromonospora sp. NPDC049662]|uniref:hypothetical protein n=1 Tax=Micromonospora sp. NPDC049662 TaxID=3155397 RepID=UPI00342EFE14